MALPSLSSQARRLDQITAIDLGARTTKAVQLQRKGEGLNFLGYVLHDAPAYEKGLSPQLLGEHLGAINQALGGRAKQVVLAVGVGDSMVRHAELPAVPVADMRTLVKFNSKKYLPPDLLDQHFVEWGIDAQPRGRNRRRPIDQRCCRGVGCQLRGSRGHQSWPARRGSIHHGNVAGAVGSGTARVY